MFLLGKKIYILIIIFAVIYLAIIVVFIYPSILSIDKVSVEIVKIRNKAASYDNQKNETENFLKNHSNYESEINGIGEMFLDKENPVKFIKFIEETATDSNVDLNIGLSSLAEKQEESDSSVDFHVFTKGSFSEILMFLERIEKSPFLAEMKNLSMNKRTDVSEKNMKEDMLETAITIKVLTKK